MRRKKVDEVKSSPAVSAESTAVRVGRERYLEIIGFTAYAYLTGKITKYSRIAGGRTRTFAEFMESFIYGKVAEEAFKLFLERELGLQTLTEIDIADFYRGIYLPDIVAVKVRGKWAPAKFWIDVKEVRRDQKWLLLPVSSVRRRPYDAYVAVWVGLPEEHAVWLAENAPGVKEKMSGEWLKKVGQIAEKIERIPCKVCGCVLWNDVISVMSAREGNLSARKRLENKFGPRNAFYFDGKTALFDTGDPAWRGARVGENVGFQLSRLKEASSWEAFAKSVLINKKIISNAPPLEFTKRGELCKRLGLPSEYSEYADYREAYHAFFTDQLKGIEKKFKGVKRKASWFTQTLA